MKKFSITLCFIVMLVAMFAFSAFAATTNNITKDAKLVEDGNCGSISVEYIRDGNYNTAASCGYKAGQTWINYHFLYENGVNVSKVVIVVNSTGNVYYDTTVTDEEGNIVYDEEGNEVKQATIAKNYPILSTLGNVYLRLYSGNSTVKTFENVSTSTATEYTNAAGDVLYTAITFELDQVYTNITKVEVATIHNNSKVEAGREYGIWEVEIYGYKCTEAADHSWDNATCEESVTKTCAYCGVTSTGHVYADATCVTPKTCTICQATEGEVSTEHTFAPATCAVPMTCIYCNETEGEKTENHVWVDANCSDPKTCSVCGTTEGEPTGDHVWVEVTCAAPKHCSKCGTEEGEALPHTPVSEDDGDCTTAIYCSVCNGAAVVSKRHTFAEGSTKCINEGCTFAGTNIASNATVTESTENWVANPKFLYDGNYATGSATNPSVRFDYVYFTYQTEREISQIFVVTNSIGTYPVDSVFNFTKELSQNAFNFRLRLYDADGTKVYDSGNKHTVNSATLYTDENGNRYLGVLLDVGYVSAAKVEVEMDSSYNNFNGLWEVEIWEHTECFFDTLVEKTTEPTCDTVGSYLYQCECGKTQAKEIPALGHTWNEGEQTKAPTEEEEGTMLYTCSVCAGTKEVAIPTLTHEHSYDTFTGEIVTAPGCATTGTGMYACRCGATQEGEVAATGNHNYTEYVETITDSTNFVEGVALYKCSDCEATKEGTLPRKNYNFVNFASDITHSSKGWHTTPGSIIDGNYNVGSATFSGAGSEIFTIKFDENYCFDKLVFVVNSVGYFSSDGAFYFTEKTANTFTFSYTIYDSNGISVKNQSLSSSNAVEMTGVDKNGNEFKYDAIVIEFDSSVVGSSVDITVDNKWNCYIGLWEFEAWGVSENVCTEHNFTAEKVIKAPTCTEKGTAILGCSSCDATTGETYELDVASHFYAFATQTNVVSPTCTTDGQRDLTCVNCGDVETFALGALGHAKAEDDTGVVTAPTCTDIGYTTYVCTREGCGVEYTIESENVAATGHTWSEEPTSTVAPTCTVVGSNTYTCTVCSETKTEEVAATGEHTFSYGDSYVYVASTCKEAGYASDVCSVCGNSFTVNYEIDTEWGHSWDAGVRNEADTGTVYTCTLCYETKEEITKGTSSEPIEVVVGDNEVKVYVDGSDSIWYVYNVTEYGYITITIADTAAIKYNANTMALYRANYNTGSTTYTFLVDPAMSSTYAIVISNDYSYVDEENAENNINYVLPTTFNVAFEAVAVPELVVGDNTVTGTLEGNRVVVTTPGSYVLSAAEGETNAIVNITYVHPMFGKTTESVELPYSFEVVEGQTMSFIINTADWSASDEINLVLANQHECVFVETSRVDSTCTVAGSVTYTCSCGESYTEDLELAEHNSNVVIPAILPTPTVTGMTAGAKCSVCGTKTVEPQEVVVIECQDQNDYKYVGISLTLDENISVNYRADVPDEYTSVYAVFVFQGKEYVVTEFTTETNSTFGNLYKFNFNQTRPDLMTENIIGNLYAVNENGEYLRYEHKDGYSIVTYCVNQLIKYNGYTNATSVNTFTMISDILVLGAETQKYMNASISNSALATEVAKSMLVEKGYSIDLKPSNFPETLDASSLNKQEVIGESPATGPDWAGASLKLGSNTAISFKFVADTLEDVTIVATIAGTEYTFTSEDMVNIGTYKGRDLYELDFYKINSLQFDEAVEVKFVVGEEEVGRVFKYSINTFIVKKYAEESSQTALIKALYNYSQSVVKRFG